MTNSMAEETLPENPTGDIDATHDFQTLARSWLSTLPADKSVYPSDVETWLRSNSSSLPDHIKSMPPSDVYQILTSFSTNVTPSNEEKDPFYFRFQRSDQWMPVYKWLETLKTDEVVNKKEIQGWLTENAAIMEDLSARHTRDYLGYYIRKCHKKILKKREKKEFVSSTAKMVCCYELHMLVRNGMFIKWLKKGLYTTVKKSSSKAHKTKEKNSPAVSPSSSATKLPKDSPTYMVNRHEAFQRYQILTEMEKQLCARFQKQETAKVVTGP